MNDIRIPYRVNPGHFNNSRSLYERVIADCPIRNARDGLVRLTTWPILGPADVRSLQDSPLDLREWLPFWLNDQWKGVRFELPPARDDLWVGRRPPRGTPFPRGGFFTNAELERMHRAHRERLTRLEE